MKKLLLVAISIWLVLIGLHAQNSLNVEITDAAKTTGKIYIALYDTNTTFLGGSPVAGKIEPVTTATTNIVFDNLSDGEYAITLFHDENDNGKLDLGEFGIPAEMYGFSNNIDPAKLMRPPLFDECKFLISGDTQISIKLISAIK